MPDFKLLFALLSSIDGRLSNITPSAPPKSPHRDPLRSPDLPLIVEDAL